MARRHSLIPYESGGGAMIALIIAAMAFLACFALSAALGATRLVTAWNDGLAGAATVRISTLQANTEERTALAVRLLKETEGVASVRILSDDDVADLLRPWFGERPAVEDLPTPRLVAVTLDRAAEPNPQIIQAKFDGAQVAAVYDDHGRWRARAASAAQSIRGLALGALALVALATAAVTAFSVRAGLAAQRPVVSALRLAGAEDRFIAAVYQKRFFWVGAVGAVIGSALAWIMAQMLDVSDKVSSVLPEVSQTQSWGVSALLVIATSAGLATLAARLSVLATLRRES